MEIERNLTVISQEGEAIKLNGKISNKCLLFQNILKGKISFLMKVDI